MHLPELVILSNPRSGTHLLLSFLTKHPEIHGKGEMFLTYQRHGIIKENIEGKLNAAILMYGQIPVFQELGGNFKSTKVIHLLRNSKDVAESWLQMQADKKILGSKYKAHVHENESLNKKGIPDKSNLENLIANIEGLQRMHIKMLEPIEHLQLNYEEFVPVNENVKYLNNDVQQRILRYLNLESISQQLYTTYIKTGGK